MQAKRMATVMRGALLWLTLGSSAQAACQITQMAFELPPYSPAASTRGHFQVKVQCDASNETYLLELMGMGGTDALRGDALQVTLSGTDPTSRLAVVVHGIHPVLAGAPLQGSQNFRFAVTAEANQWIGAGDYAAQLSVTLKSIDILSPPPLLVLTNGDQP